MKTIHYKRTSFFLAAAFFTTGIFILRTATDYNNVYQQVQISTTERQLFLTSKAAHHRHVTKSLSELGKMDETNSHVLFFNRIPHSGSELLILLLQKLQGWNNFKHIRLKDDNKRTLTNIEEEELVSEVYEQMKQTAVPISFDRYVHFVNFSKFDRQSPTFCNLIRDPIENVVSRFASVAAKNNAFKNLDLETCLKKRDDRCIFKQGDLYDLTIPYFCGQDERCMMLGSSWALEKAKQNVKRYYPVVGILEEVNVTVEVLESKLPYFFKGAQKMFSVELHLPHIHHYKKLKISKYVRTYLEEKLHKEYEFYLWIKERLFEQLQIMYGEHKH